MREISVSPSPTARKVQTSSPPTPTIVSPLAFFAFLLFASSLDCSYSLLTRISHGLVQGLGQLPPVTGGGVGLQEQGELGAQVGGDGVDGLPVLVGQGTVFKGVLGGGLEVAPEGPTSTVKVMVSCSASLPLLGFGRYPVSVAVRGGVVRPDPDPVSVARPPSPAPVSHGRTYAKWR